MLIKKYTGFLFLLLALLSFNNAVLGQILDPVKWDIKAEHTEGDYYQLTFTADIEEGWIVYSKYTEDNGPVPTSINYDTPEVISLEGGATEEGSKEAGFDKLFEVDVIKFKADKPYIINQTIKVLDYSKPLVGYLTFMTCDKSKCLPPKDIDFEFDFSKIPGSQAKNEPAPVASLNIAGIDEEAPQASGTLDPVDWDLDIRKESEDTYVLKFSANIQEGWTVYSQYTSDEGPVPTTITYEGDAVFDKMGEAKESGKKKEGYDKIFDMDVVKFLADEPYVIEQKIKTSDTGKMITGYLTYMTCDKTKCLPPTDVDFVFDLANLKAGEASVMIPSGGMKLEGNSLDQLIPSIWETHKKPIGDCGEVVEEKTDFWSVFLGGFLGGLIAILLPCIFPMIPITVSFFSKDSSRKGWVNGLIYGLSIVVIFVAIGLAVTAALGPEALNRLSTNWIANTFFFLVFIAFAISFFGYFEIALPSSWSTKSDQMADKGGLLGTFFMAATLAIVSFSCTGPIIGTALVQVASSGSYIGPFAVMLGFSVALALPFGLFAAFPAWLNSLPRSGSWMTSVKVVLGFLELALALKFLSVADMTSHWDFLKYELFLGLWILIAAGMTMYLFGWIRFPHDSPLKKLSPVRWFFALGSLFITLYLCTGFMVNKDTGLYRSTALTSGLAPPAHYNFFLPPGKVDPVLKAKYPSLTKCANNIDCFKDYYEGVAYAKETNKPILLDFTGYGCVNCRKTEEFIWVETPIRNLLNNEMVLISLYVDDDEKLDEVLVSKQRGNKIRNVGNKWADFQIVNFEQNSQPLYIVMSPDEQVLTPPRPFQEGSESYREFLLCGLNAHRNRE